MFDCASPSYSLDFPPLESFEHPQTNTKHIWKIKNPIGTNPDGTIRHVSSAEAALNWQAENVVTQNQALSKILDNQQMLAQVITHTFSSSSSLVDDLKKKIKMVEQELTTIVSTVKDMFVCFPLIGQKEKERKQLLTQLQSIEGSQKTVTQPSLMLAYTPFQHQQSLYKDLSIPLTSPFSSTSPGQNVQPLAMKHPNYNPFKTSGIFPTITYPSPPKPNPKPGHKMNPLLRKGTKNDYTILHIQPLVLLQNL